MAEAQQSDVRHNRPQDNTSKICWLLEDPVNAGGVLTQDGLTQIAEHKYKAGYYTPLDNFFNPYWTQLTELLPMSVAPNLVTLVGGCCCVLSYCVTWYYLPNFTTQEDVPNWLCLLNGVMYLLYYTLDCMDGKQARRTNTSTPLGQLFDHGVDVFCALSHLSGVHAYAQAGDSWCYLYTHLALQTCFFIAQWGEYYTGVLQHSIGNIGVTEVNLGTASLSILNAFVDRKIYRRNLEEILGLSKETMKDFSPFMASLVQDYPMKKFMAFFWVAFASYLIFNSVISVPRQFASSHHPNPSFWQVVSCVSKLWVPFGIVGTVVFLECTMEEEPKQMVIYNHVRYWSLAVGFAFCLLTNKIIVFSMAKMAYATIQADAMVLMGLLLWLSWEFRDYSEQQQQTRYGLTPLGLLWVWRFIVFGFLIRFVTWNKIAIEQIAKRLDVNVFTIKKKGEKKIA